MTIIRPDQKPALTIIARPQRPEGRLVTDPGQIFRYVIEANLESLQRVDPEAAEALSEILDIQGSVLHRLNMLQLAVVLGGDHKPARAALENLEYVETAGDGTVTTYKPVIKVAEKEGNGSVILGTDTVVAKKGKPTLHMSTDIVLQRLQALLRKETVVPNWYRKLDPPRSYVGRSARVLHGRRPVSEEVWGRSRNSLVDSIGQEDGVLSVQDRNLRISTQVCPIPTEIMHFRDILRIAASDRVISKRAAYLAATH